MAKKKKDELDDDFDLLDGEVHDGGGIFNWLYRNKAGLLLIIGLVLMVLLILAVASFRNISRVAEAEGEIVEISEGLYRVIAKNIIFLEEGESIENPVNISAGVCFLEAHRDKCDVGTKVSISKYRSLFSDWWVQDSIIKSYNQSL